MAAAVIGAVGDEEEFHAGVGEAAGGFGEFDVVADLDADFDFSEVDDFEVGAALDLPCGFFPWGDVEFFLAVALAFGAEEEGDVEEAVVFDDGL